MKKLSLAASLATFATFSATQAFADTAITNTCPTNGFHFLCLQATQLGPVIGSFITLVFVLVGLVALGYLVFGGFKWLTSQGEKQAVEEARNHIVAAIIGLIIIFLSYLAVNVLLSFLTGGQVTLNNLILPSIGQ